MFFGCLSPSVQFFIFKKYTWFIGGVKVWLKIPIYENVQSSCLGKSWVHLCVIEDEMVLFGVFVNISFSYFGCFSNEK